jgi:succinate-semialdehyde dehydrogenase/glutarate-semialdehyde dehydrogenase
MSLNLKDPDLFRTRCYVDGQWIDADDGATVSIRNPANGEVLGTIPRMGAAETRRAIEAANAAWPAWRALTAGARAKILRRWFELILANQEDLAVLMTSEQGKPLAEARGEVLYAASFIEWFAEEGKRIYGDVIPGHQPDKRIVVTKEPIGVCAAITPWNFPAAMITRKAGPALAAGCTMVLKPATQTPYSALALAVLAERAGVPKGVFSVVTGGAAEIGGELTANPIVRKLTFTGSTEIGVKLMGQCAPSVKKLSLELGGNAPFIVFDDADLDRGRGRDRLQVPQHRPDLRVRQPPAGAGRRVRRLRRQARRRGGAPEGRQRPGRRHYAGPADRHERGGQGRGAHRRCGGEGRARARRRQAPRARRQLLRAHHPGRRDPGDEGGARGDLRPGGAAVPLQDEAEAIRMANDTEFGLAAYFFANSMNRVWRVAEALEYGIVGINTGIISTEVAPFGGVKSSGLGREGSKYGIEDYLEVKYLCMGGVQ